MVVSSFLNLKLQNSDYFSWAAEKYLFIIFYEARNKDFGAVVSYRVLRSSSKDLLLNLA